MDRNASRRLRVPGAETIDIDPVVQLHPGPNARIDRLEVNTWVLTKLLHVGVIISPPEMVILITSRPCWRQEARTGVITFGGATAPVGSATHRSAIPSIEWVGNVCVT